jgi:hypothetical protein
LEIGIVVLTRPALVASPAAPEGSAWRWPYWPRWSLSVAT